MVLEFEGEAIEWRGPAPFVFVPVPPDPSDVIKSLASQLTYGWGVIPVTVQVGDTRITTSLFPKDGIYLVPIKALLQRAEGIEPGGHVRVRLELMPEQKSF